MLLANPKPTHPAGQAACNIHLVMFRRRSTLCSDARGFRSHPRSLPYYCRFSAIPHLDLTPNLLSQSTNTGITSAANSRMEDNTLSCGRLPEAMFSISCSGRSASA